MQTIHSNALGDVLNETSATGVRITDAHGRTAEVRIEGGIAVIRTPKGRLISLGVYDNPHITGKQPTAVIVDEIVPIKELMALTNSVAGRKQED